MFEPVKSHDDQPLVVTVEGYERLRSKLDRLTTEERSALSGELREARDDGDLAVNPALLEALEEHEELERRIAALQLQLLTAKITRPAADGSASLGTRVRVRTVETDEVDEYELVSEPEADVTNGRLSVEAPVGAALVGRHPGAVIEALTPGGAVQLELLSVETLHKRAA